MPVCVCLSISVRISEGCVVAITRSMKCSVNVSLK